MDSCTPKNFLTTICILQYHVPYLEHTELISHIISAASIYFNFTGKAKCFNLAEEDDIGADMWNYQVKLKKRAVVRIRICIFMDPDPPKMQRKIFKVGALL